VFCITGSKISKGKENSPNICQENLAFPPTTNLLVRPIFGTKYKRYQNIKDSDAQYPFDRKINSYDRV
jgi:hypothetical protein